MQMQQLYAQPRVLLSASTATTQHYLNSHSINLSTSLRRGRPSSLQAKLVSGTSSIISFNGLQQFIGLPSWIPRSSNMDLSLSLDVINRKANDQATRFHFADPTAVERFASAVDRNHSDKIENLVLTIHSARREVRYRWETTLSERKPLAIAEHFPHLKTIVIKLRGQYELLTDTDLQNFCAILAQKLQPCKEIEWIHINGLVDAGAMFSFTPLIRPSPSSAADGRFAQTHATNCC